MTIFSYPDRCISHTYMIPPVIQMRLSIVDTEVCISQDSFSEGQLFIVENKNRRLTRNSGIITLKQPEISTNIILLLLMLPDYSRKTMIEVKLYV